MIHPDLSPTGAVRLAHGNRRTANRLQADCKPAAIRLQFGCIEDGHPSSTNPRLPTMTLEAALQQLVVGRKAKRLQSLWPTIERKLAEGVSHAEILRSLNENGFALTERTYKSYLYRYRKRRRSMAPQPASTHVSTLTPENANLAQGPTPPASTEAETPKRPPTFDYDPRGIPELLK